MRGTVARASHLSSMSNTSVIRDPELVAHFASTCSSRRRNDLQLLVRRRKVPHRYGRRAGLGTRICTACLAYPTAKGRARQGECDGSHAWSVREALQHVQRAVREEQEEIQREAAGAPHGRRCAQYTRLSKAISVSTSSSSHSLPISRYCSKSWPMPSVFTWISLKRSTSTERLTFKFKKRRPAHLPHMLSLLSAR